MSPATLMTVGEALAVFLVTDGSTLSTAKSFRRILSGSEVNVAAGFTRMGHRSRLVTRVGQDGLGDGVASDLAAEGIDARVHRSRLSTGTLVRDLSGPDGGHAVHLRERSAATEITPDDIDEAWSPDVDVVFVTGITAVRSSSARSAVERLVELARANGALTVVDPNLRPALGSPEQFEEALRGIRGRFDVAIGDPGELALLAGTSTARAEDALLEMGCATVVTKHGAGGVEVVRAAERVHVPSAASTVVDTVGAGDSFTAGFLAGLVEGRTLADSAEFGSMVAARVVGTAGDIDGIPVRADLKEGVSP